MMDFLRCPHTRMVLTAATAELVAALLGRREELRNHDGEMPELFEAGLVAGAWFYPVRGGIPVLLPGEAIGVGKVE